MESLITVYKDGKEQDLSTFATFSSLVFIDAGARAGELYPDENGPGVYFMVDEENDTLKVRGDLGTHVEQSHMPFPFEVEQVTYGNAEIHMFEPNPDFIEALKKKAEFISKKNCIVWVHQIAVGNSSNLVKLKRTSGGWGSTTCDNKENEEFVDEVEVQQIDFLNFIHNLKVRSDNKDQAVHIKMDIEGSEYDILASLFKSWHMCCGNIKSLSIEFHRDFYKEKHDKWITDYWTAIVTLIKSGLKFNWWPGEW